MKKVFFAALLVMIAGVAQAQKVYFIYIQSEAGTPFFVKMGDKIASSTASGYCILHKLVDSTYNFTVGKVGQGAGAESRFSITINKKDRGFLLKELDGKMGLFDLQALTLTQPVSFTAPAGTSTAKRTDAFTVLLAQAANDPSLLDVRAQPAAMPQPATASAAPVVAVADVAAPIAETAVASQPLGNETETTKADSPAATTTPAATETSIAEPEPKTVAVQTEPVLIDETEINYKPSVVTRRSESSTSEGFGLVFLDRSETATDTIRILIPNQASRLRKEESNDGDSKKFLNISSIDTSKRDTAATSQAAPVSLPKIDAPQVRTPLQLLQKLKHAPVEIAAILFSCMPHEQQREMLVTKTTRHAITLTSPVSSHAVFV